MEFKNIVTQTANKKAYIKIDRPKHLNSLNKETLLEIEEAVDIVSDEENIRVLIITGKGDKAFVAGADIREMKEKNFDEAKEFAILGQQVFKKIENCPKPVIAVVNGHALGGGCELALACDIRIASKNAQFGQPEVGLGIIPGFGGTQRLSRIIGDGLAREYIYTGRYVNSRKAKEIGLINHLTELDELDKKAEEIADEIIANSPSAVEKAKEAINYRLNSFQDEGLEFEAHTFGECFNTYDQQEGMSAFLKREEPQFKGE
ncbi:MAG: enoyl-CoA hydratase/isomerase family protein [Halanaerobiales bacterium]|nr:enoyl-CoA hydratase/isomerase family protein [Halanaerobiales bacterium]